MLSHFWVFLHQHFFFLILSLFFFSLDNLIATIAWMDLNSLRLIQYTCIVKFQPPTDSNLIQRKSKLPNSLPLYFNEGKIKTSNACCFKWLMGTTNSMLSSNFCTFVSRARSFRGLFCSIISVRLSSLPLLCNFFFF